MGAKRKTEKDYRELAEKRGFKWLGPFPGSTLRKSVWQCSKNHRWKVAYGNIQQGSGCPYCARQAPKIPQDYCTIAIENGLEWLGPFPQNTRAKTRWKCSGGHEIEKSYNNIQQGHGCRYCANQIPKSPTDYYEIADRHNFKWLGPFPIDTDSVTWWECSENHKWGSCYGSIRAGKGCPYCAGNMPKIIEDYHKLALERNFKWCGPFPPRVIIPTEWECAEGHRWYANYNNVKRGGGCPHCIDLVNGQRVSNVQRELCDMILGGILNYPWHSRRIDIALPDRKIAVEYDSWYWHGHRQKEDKQRNKELRASGWKVLWIKSNEKLPTKAQIDMAFAELELGKNLVEIILSDWGQGSHFISGAD